MRELADREHVDQIEEQLQWIGFLARPFALRHIIMMPVRPGPARNRLGVSPFAVNHEGMFGEDAGQGWTDMFRQAREWDRLDVDRSNNPIPPILAPLVHAVVRTPLRRLYPYTSHATLCFCVPGRMDVTAPVAIGLKPDPAEYILWWGHPFLEVHPMWRAKIQMLSDDPVLVAAEAALLAADWLRSSAEVR
jgi:hypothetical protein